VLSDMLTQSQIMADNNLLKLNNNNPNVIAALNAEQQLFDFYGLKAKTHYVKFPGLNIRMRVSEIGTGKPVIIVPGNTGDVFPLIPLLAELKDRRIIAINRPGGGLSEGMDHSKISLREFASQMVTAVLDAFGLDRAPIVAHSIGGHMSLWAAMDNPERVSALTLLGVPGNIINTGPPFALRLLSVPGLNSLLLNLIKPKSPKQSLRGLSVMGHSPEILATQPEAMSECYYYFPRLPNYKISILSLMERGNIFGAGDDKISAEDLKSVRPPTMFLWGTKDPFGSITMGQKIAGMVPSSEFHAIAGGHLPWLDEPVECGRLIRDFLSAY
jgi:2-hydroxy-6-oxonona-2,4-dienedioate hydrolase